MEEHTQGDATGKGGYIGFDGVNSKSKVAPTDPPTRDIPFGKDATQIAKYCSNSVRTSKYTTASWAPKSLLWQFRRAANIYFLIISILTTFEWSPKDAWSMCGTFAGILIFTMFKEAYEDYGRHKSDSFVNNSLSQVYDHNKREFVETTFKDIKVGDILKVCDNEPFPADLVFISSSVESGLAFINTMNLDGETNLKERVALDSTKNIRSHEDLHNMKGLIACDLPDMSLIRWNCNLNINDNKKEFLSMNQLLLRGCVLKNTDYVYGVVIYTGHESKIMLNSKAAPSKTSKVLSKMNRMLYTVFILQTVICFIFAIATLQWTNSNADDHFYLDLSSDPGFGDYIIQVLVFFVAYSHMIPISLYVALEIVKMALAYLLRQDLDMYYEEDDKPAATRTSDLIEELGQVEFIFSDKTGTLTCNVMDFKKCSINGKIFGEGDRPAGASYYGVGLDKTPAELMQRPPTDPDRIAIDRFFTLMAVCHTVFPVQDPDNPKQPTYQAASPDELALVQGSAAMGFVFQEKTNQAIITQYAGETPQEWEYLAVIPFNSTRKRMSIVVRDPNTKKLLLMSKGADNIMMDLLEPNQSSVISLQRQLDEFAVEGLRTLVMAQRYIEESEWKPWFEKWNEINFSNSENKEDELADHGSLLERNLELVGASAIEDKLQKGVPEAIALLMEADIRVWVLTGDKQETAIEIGKSCSLIKQDMDLIILSSETLEEFKKKVTDLSQRYGIEGKSWTELGEIKDSLSQQIAIVINGSTLAWTLDRNNAEIRQQFFKLGFISNSCICCRVSPAQKMQVVALAKSNGPWVTLGIGDGANDVSMIQEAHIGVGISGKEGTQAVQASDYAFSQFRFLEKLILVHGRWGYRRISWFICYYFYKNVAVLWTEIWFAIFNGFSGQIYFLDWLPILYNSFWTSWPCIFTYIFEQDANAQQSLKNPQLYGAGQKDCYFTFSRFWLWMILSIWHGLVCYWVPILGFSSCVDASGLDTGLWWISTLSFTLVIHTVTLKLFIESVFWNKINVTIGILSILIYYFVVIVLNTPTFGNVFQPQLTFLFFQLLSNGKAWLIILLAPLIALTPDFIILHYRGIFNPTPTDKVMMEAKIKE